MRLLPSQRQSMGSPSTKSSRRESSRRAAFLGWGLQFLGAGVNPVPPPQVQLEEVNAQARLKKDAESGDPA